jgi:hypothetical protein
VIRNSILNLVQFDFALFLHLVLKKTRSPRYQPGGR